MAAAVAAGNAVRKRASILELVKDFWSVNRSFRSLMTDLEAATAITREDIPQLDARLRELYTTVSQTLDMCRERGFTHRALVNGSIHSLQSCNARLQDYLERLELSLDPNLAIETAEAIAEYERGETISLDSLL
jgi:hypothetical protein